MGQENENKNCTQQGTPANKKKKIAAFRCTEMKNDAFQRGAVLPRQELTITRKKLLERKGMEGTYSSPQGNEENIPVYIQRLRGEQRFQPQKSAGTTTPGVTKSQQQGKREKQERGGHRVCQGHR